LHAVVGEGSRFHYMHLQKEHQKFAAGVWHKILMLLYHSRLKSSGKQSHWSFAEKNTTLHKK